MSDIVQPFGVVAVCLALLAAGLSSKHYHSPARDCWFINFVMACACLFIRATERSLWSVAGFTFVIILTVACGAVETLAIKAHHDGVDHGGLS